MIYPELAESEAALDQLGGFVAGVIVPS
jgi:hypothetical protein